MPQSSRLQRLTDVHTCSRYDCEDLVRRQKGSFLGDPSLPGFLCVLAAIKNSNAIASGASRACLVPYDANDVTLSESIHGARRGTM